MITDNEQIRKKLKARIYTLRQLANETEIDYHRLCNFLNDKSKKLGATDIIRANKYLEK